MCPRARPSNTPRFLYEVPIDIKIPNIATPIQRSRQRSIYIWGFLLYLLALLCQDYLCK